MKSILLTKGPVTSFEGIRKNMIKMEEYTETAKNLANLGLGFYKVVNSVGLFIKKTPDEFQSIMDLRPDEFLCNLETYRKRYHMAMPKYYIRSKDTKSKMVSLGLITEEQMQ